VPLPSGSVNRSPAAGARGVNIGAQSREEFHGVLLPSPSRRVDRGPAIASLGMHIGPQGVEFANDFHLPRLCCDVHGRGPEVVLRMQIPTK